ncbi:probable glutamate receptor isoform X2 [Macrobrachium rosenbergii]
MSLTAARYLALVVLSRYFCPAESANESSSSLKSMDFRSPSFDSFELSELLKALLVKMDKKNLFMCVFSMKRYLKSLFSDVVRSLASVLREKTGLMIFRYQKALLELGHLLAPATGRQLLMLLCSSNVILEIFEKVQEKELDSHFVSWLVILDNIANLEKVILGLKGNIDEGTQVILLAVKEEMQAKVFITRPDPQDIVSFRNLGTWDILSSRSMRLLPALLMSDIRDQYADLRGREIIAGGNDNLPLMKKRQIDPDGNIIPAYGMDIGILDTLSPVLNYTYHVVDPPDGLWGGPLPNGTSVGLIGMVVRKEVTLAMSGMSIIGPREDVVDMSWPYYEDQLNLVSRAPQKLNRTFATFTPFSLQVWILLIVATLSLGPILKIVSKATEIILNEEDPNRQLLTYSFNIFRSTVAQGNMMEVKLWPERFIFIFWYLVCIVVSALYSGTLTAFLAIPSYEKPIDSLTDIPRAIKEGFILGTLKDSVIEYLLKGSTQGIYKQTWDLFHHKDLKESLIETPPIGFNKVMEQKFVFIAPATVSAIAATTRGREKFHLGRGRFFPLRYGIAFHTGSPLKDKFSHLILRLVEGGLVVKWKDDTVLKMSRASKVLENSATHSAISLANLQGAFYVLALGFVVSTITLLIENIVCFKCQSAPN